jgi:hypothetical protein
VSTAEAWYRYDHGVGPIPAGKRPDPVAAVNRLGAIWSDDLGAYASGQLGIGQVHCALCQCAPCRCPAFGSAGYLALLDQRHGRGPRDVGR